MEAITTDVLMINDKTFIKTKEHPSQGLQLNWIMLMKIYNLLGERKYIYSKYYQLVTITKGSSFIDRIIPLGHRLMFSKVNGKEAEDKLRM